LIRVSKEDYIDPRYKKYMKSKKGEKMITLLRILTERAFTRDELRDRTGFSLGEIRNLLLEAVDENFVAEIRGTKVQRSRGRSITQPYKKEETTRPPSHYALTSEAMWLMRFDPETRDRWKEVERTYDKTVTFTAFDSYANLLYAIQKHPILRQYRKPYYFMDQVLQQVPLNPFTWGGPREGEMEKVYDELVKVIKESVRSEHISAYYRVLEDAISELNVILARHKLLMKKMQAIPEVQQHLDERSQ